MNKSIIVVVQDNIPECWGNFKKMCLANGYPYFTLARLKFPIVYKGVTIYKVVFN